MSVQAGAFIQKAGAKLQPLREGIAIMRIDVNHLISVLQRLGGAQ
jgi:hypothetical protein